ncbi:hypothetical protein P4S72_15290 [Vibrio sp. PP-XX7]
MMSQLTTRIKETLANSSDSGRDWVICTGGILTTHVTDIKHFLAGAEVQNRLTTLNAAYAHAVPLNAVSVPTSHIGLMRLKSLEAATPKNTQFDELNALVNRYRQDPLCTVRNRAGILVYKGSSTGEIIPYSIEKQGESTVDLTLGILQNGKIGTGGQITEWLANYPLSVLLTETIREQAPISTASPAPACRLFLIIRTLNWAQKSASITDCNATPHR